MAKPAPRSPCLNRTRSGAAVAPLTDFAKTAFAVRTRTPV